MTALVYIVAFIAAALLVQDVGDRLVAWLATPKE